MPNFIVSIFVDEKILKQQCQNSQDDAEILSTEQLIEQEFDWLSTSGIKLEDIDNREDILSIQFIADDVIEHLTDEDEEEKPTKHQAAVVLQMMQRKGFANQDIYEHIETVYRSLYEYDLAKYQLETKIDSDKVHNNMSEESLVAKLTELGAKNIISNVESNSSSNLPSFCITATDFVRQEISADPVLGKIYGIDKL